MKRRTIHALLGILSLVCALSLSACNKCRRLAEYVCACNESLMSRESCKKSLDVQGQHSAFEKAADENLCAHLVDKIDKKTGCDCLAVLNNDFARCGMTRDEWPDVVKANP